VGERLVEDVVCSAIQEAVVRITQCIYRVSTLPTQKNANVSEEAIVEYTRSTLLQLLDAAHKLYPFANYARDVASAALAGFYTFAIAVDNDCALRLLLTVTDGARSRWPEDVRIACYRIACLDYHRRRHAEGTDSSIVQHRDSVEILECYYIGSRAADKLGQCQSMNMFYSGCVSRGVQWAFSLTGDSTLGAVYSKCVLIYRITKTAKTVSNLCASAKAKAVAEVQRVDDIMACDGASFHRQFTARKNAADREFEAVDEVVRMMAVQFNNGCVANDVQEWTISFLAVISEYGAVVMRNALKTDVNAARNDVRELGEGLRAYMESGGERSACLSDQ